MGGESELAHIGGVKRQDDIICGHTLFQQGCSNADLSTIMLNLDSAVFDIEVYTTSMCPTGTAPVCV